MRGRQDRGRGLAVVAVVLVFGGVCVGAVVAVMVAMVLMVCVI